MADTRPSPGTPTLDQDEMETEAEAAAERHLVHDVLLGALIAIPIGVVVCLGIVLLGVQFASVPAGTPELMAVFVGVLFGVFFGALSGFVKNTAALDELDRHGGHSVAPKPVA